MDATNEEAYDRWFRTEYDAVWHSVRLIVVDREVAREVTQDAFMALFSHWEKVSTYDRPGAWVRRVAIRQAVKVAGRDGGRRRAVLTHAFQSRTAEHSSPGPVGDGTTDMIVEALRALSPNQRAAVAMHYLLDLSVRDVAAAIGCSEATANVHLHRGRRRLDDVLTKEIDNGIR